MDEYRRRDVAGRTVVEYYLNLYYRFNFTEGQYDVVDFTSESKDGSRKYVGDVKAYLNPRFPRYSNAYPDYQIDYDKLRQIKKRGVNSDSKPILIAVFTDKLVVWDLNKSKWEQTAEWVKVVKDGVSRGEKEYELQAKLYLNDAIFTIDREEGDYVD